MSPRPFEMLRVAGRRSRASPELALSELRQQWRALLQNPRHPRISAASCCGAPSHTACRKSRSAGFARSANASSTTLQSSSTKREEIRRPYSCRTEIGHPAGLGEWQGPKPMRCSCSMTVFSWQSTHFCSLSAVAEKDHGHAMVGTAVLRV